MRKFRSLTFALLKNNMNFISDAKETKSKWKTITMLILLVFGFFPLFGLLYAMFATYFDAYQVISQSGSVLAIGFFLCAFLVFFFSIFIIPGVFYFSKDNSTLLTLPLKPHTILAAKFTTCLFYDYAFSILAVIPLTIAYAQYFPFGIWELFCFLLVALTLPIIPLIYSSIITMIMMRFIPFVKNKDVFNMISGIFIVIVALVFSFFMNSLSVNDQASLINLLMEGNNSFISLFSSFFPFVENATRMILDASIPNAIFYLLWNIGFICLFLLLGKYIYFKGAIGINESSSKSQIIDIHKFSHKTPILRAYAIKEFKLLLRTPVYFTNCILAVIIVPVIFFIPIFQPEIRDTIASFPMDELLTIPQFNNYVILAIIVLSCFFAPMSSISQTAISREGDHVAFMKYIPLSFKTQLLAKSIVGILMSMASILPLWLFVLYYLNFPIDITFYSFIGVILTCISLNLIGILIDTARPKLLWEQETAAVKQNLNAVLPMLISLLLCTIIVVGALNIPSDYTFVFMLGILLLLGSLCIISYYIIDKKACKMFEKIY